ncbi:MAG TPA: ATP-binding protein [Thermoanaerobaculia bacterium]|nr:ATP-binding protein [Thermoanaerobaculia bacterium]
MSRWRDWPWAAKLAFLLGALAIVPLAVVTLYNAAVGRSELIAAASEQNLRQARNTAGSIDDYLAGVRSDLQIISLAPGTARFLAGTPGPALAADVRLALIQMRDTHGFDALYLTGHGGRVRLATEDRFLGRNYVSAPYVRNAMAGNASLDPPRWDPTDRRVFIHASAPVRDSRGRIVGAAVGRIPFDGIDHLVAADTGFAGRGEFGVVWSSDGIRLSHPTRPALRFRAFEKLAPETAARLAAENRFGPDTPAKIAGGPLLPGLVERSRWLLFDQAAGPFLRIETGGQVIHAAIVPLRGARWLYGIFSPEEAILASVQQQTRRNLLLAVLTALMAAGASFLAAHWVTGPLRQVGTAAQALAAGDMSRRVGLRQHDEVGRLAIAFDGMAEALAAKEAELRGYADRLEQRVEEQTAALRASEEELRSLYAVEQELRHRAEEANRIKDEFLSTVSHELRTPLNAILGWTWLLVNGKLDGEGVQRAIATIERNARAQGQIIDDLLDVSRIITGKLRLSAEPVDLLQVVEAVLDSVSPAAEAKDIRIERRLDPAAARAKGDPQRLQQIVWNLLSNAVKFTPRGGRVEVALARRHSQIEIRVTDSGIGIHPDFLAHVFDRFRQADSSSTRTHGGLGLGLAIVRHLVELHGGTVEARSGGEGQGATFAVRLPVPVLAPSLPTPEPFLPATPGRPLAEEDAARVRGLKVLLVDDEPGTREMLLLLLSQFGVQATAAASAAEALEALDRAPVDLLLADIGMPGEDGYSLIRKVRSLNGSNGRLPAIALTAYASETDRQRALAAGFQRHLAKPVEAYELISALAALAGSGVREA